MSKMIAFDVETIGRKMTEEEAAFHREKVQIELDNISAPSNWKDPDKIEAYHNKARMEIETKFNNFRNSGSALSIFYSEIVSASVTYEENGKEITKNWINNKKGVKLHESNVWKVLLDADEVWAYTDFDKLQIKDYCLKNNKVLPFVNYRDLSYHFSRYEFGKKIIPSLKELAAVYLDINYPNMADQIDTFFLNELYDEITEYNNMDSIVTFRLAKIIQKLNL